VRDYKIISPFHTHNTRQNRTVKQLSAVLTYVNVCVNGILLY